MCTVLAGGCEHPLRENASFIYEGWQHSASLTDSKGKCLMATLRGRNTCMCVCVCVSGFFFFLLSFFLVSSFELQSMQHVGAFNIGPGQPGRATWPAARRPR